MDWFQLLTVIFVPVGTTLTLFLWSRGEAEQVRRSHDNILRSIHEEMKDFHGRLCAIEERNKVRIERR